MFILTHNNVNVRLLRINAFNDVQPERDDGEEEAVGGVGVQHETVTPEWGLTSDFCIKGPCVSHSKLQNSTDK